MFLSTFSVYNLFMNKYPNIKYLVFDLDDTLLRRDRTISDYTVEVLKKAQDKGMFIVFNTSRSVQHSQRYIDLVHPDYGIYSGGCQIFNKDKEIFSRLIPSDDVEIITKYLTSLGMMISVQTKTTFYASDKEYKGQNAVWTDFTNGLKEAAFKILAFSMDFKLVKEIADKFNLEWQNYLGSGWNRLSIKGATKWNGIEHLLELVKGNKNEVAAFGDDYGDMEMIELSGLGVAMANSKKEVLDIAPNIAPNNDEDGCAKFIENNLL